ncbi:MAG TPA: hypothetical protein VM165_13400, partial [Planctomycetaceae bacterium]|nr:hypothetical protein [Planctomycetaceae bacterium]
MLRIRQKVQGMAVDDEHIVLSISYGRDNMSTLAVYENPWKIERASPHRTMKVGRSTVPLWFLDGQNRVKEVGYAPMSEGITLVNDRLAVITESGGGEISYHSQQLAARVGVGGVADGPDDGGIEAGGTPGRFGGVEQVVDA